MRYSCLPRPHAFASPLPVPARVARAPPKPPRDRHLRALSPQGVPSRAGPARDRPLTHGCEHSGLSRAPREPLRRPPPPYRPLDRHRAPRRPLLRQHIPPRAGRHCGPRFPMHGVGAGPREQGGHADACAAHARKAFCALIGMPATPRPTPTPTRTWRWCCAPRSSTSSSAAFT